MTVIRARDRLGRRNAEPPPPHAWKALAPRIGRGQGRRRLRKTNQATALYRVAGIARSDTITDTSTTPPSQMPLCW
jgi:hypothetical protein